nr:ABC transporter substrate-binding protein [uncultured Pseudodesulfovibrio sp.]
MHSNISLTRDTMRLIIFIIICINLLLPSPVEAEEIRFMTHNLQGQTYLDMKTGNIRGIKHAGKRSFNLEVVLEMKKMMGNTTRITQVPFARGLEILNTQKSVAFFNVNRTPERRSLYKWVGPLQSEVDYLYGLKKMTNIHTLDAARNVRSICVVNGNAQHMRLFQMGFTNVVTNNSYENCFQMLKNGRVDLAALSELALEATLAKAHIQPSAIHRVPEVLLQSEGYIAFSPDTNDVVISQWQNAFDTMLYSGAYTRLFGLYFNPN